MCPEKPSDTRRSNRWSNPNIQDSGTATGTAASNNVARTISARAATITNFRPRAAFPLNASISGNSYITSYGSQTYIPIVSCGNAPYTYLWERSYDGINYASGSNVENYSFSIYPSNRYSIYLRLRVTSGDGQSVVAFFTISIPNGGSARINTTNVNLPQVNRLDSLTSQLSQTVSIISNLPHLIVQEDKLIQFVYPNPLQDQLNTSISLPDNDKITLSIINGQGSIIKTIFTGELAKGVHNFSESVQNYQNGIYFIQLMTTNKSEVTKIIVQK